MGAYLDRLNDQYDTIVEGIDEILNRAAEDNRDVTEDEEKLVEREQAKAEDLKKSIEHYAALEVTRAKVAETRAKVPATTPKRDNVQVVERDQKLTDLFPTAGHYLTTAGRMLRGDQDAAEQINRAIEVLERDTTTKHQTTAENPGLLPRPILGPIITLVDNARPFISSISTKPLPAGKFDRPKITQHVGVGKQAAEKDRTESRQLKVDLLPVAAATYAGHLNVSRQDIKWATPSLMQLLAEDFAHEYALETDEDAVNQFIAGLGDNDPVVVPDWEVQSLRKVLFTAATTPYKNGEPAGLPDTFWMAADVWAQLGSLVNPNGVPYWPGLTPGNPASGDILGYKPVVDPWFPPGTAVLGKGSLVEWYEDLDGFLQVAEPDVLGQLVGYAGYGAELNTAPSVFTVLTLPAVEGEAAEAAAETVSQATSKASKK